MKTTAQTIAARFGGDGQCWEDGSGRHISDVCGDETRSERHDGHEMDRFVFEDGSAITLAGGAWDFGYADCWCWRGAGHTDGCCSEASA